MFAAFLLLVGTGNLLFDQARNSVHPAVDILQGQIVDRVGALVTEQVQRALLQFPCAVQQAVRSLGDQELGKTVERDGKFDKILECRILAITLPGNQYRLVFSASSTGEQDIVWRGRGGAFKFVIIPDSSRFIRVR